MACFHADELASLSADTKMLELGVGQRPKWHGSVTLDINLRSKAQVIHDLNCFPYPFEDDTFDIVLAEHVIEHLDDVVRVVDEIHRILKPGGRLYVEVPHFSSSNHSTDPTHRHAFGVRSFDYFCPLGGSTSLYEYHYSCRDWGKIRVELIGESETWFGRLVTSVANRHSWRYERDFAWIFPQMAINFVLEAIKER